MKLYKKNMLLFFVLFFANSAINGKSGSTITDHLSTFSNNVKRELLGPSLAPIDDPRVIGIIVAGVLSILCGGLINYAVFASEKENEQKSFLKKALAFIIGNAFISSGFFAILFSRAHVTAIDELSYRVLEDWNKNKN